MRGVRLTTGFLIMGVAVPVALFFLLRLSTLAQWFTIAATTFLSWGVAELLATILEKPRLSDRSPRQAFREDLDRRAEH